MFPYSQLIPVFAKDVLGVGPTLMGILAGSDGVGAVVGIAVIAALGNPRYPGILYIGGTLLASIVLVFFAVSVWYPVSVALLAVFGFGLGGYAAMQFALILRAAPKEMAGRVIGAMLVAMGAWPLGSLLMGTLAELLGPQMAVGISAGAAALLLVLLFFLLPEMRHRELSTPPTVKVSTVGTTLQDERLGAG